MTINMATNGTAGTSAMDYSQLKVSGSSSSVNSQASSSSTSELTEEEKKYDVDSDGTLSITEKAAYLEAKAKEKVLESASKSANSENAATVSISDEALKLQKEGPQGASRPKPPDVNEMSDEDLKSMLSDMKDKHGQLPKELSDYNDADIDSLSEDDLKNIREAMTKMRDKLSEQKNGQPENEQQRLMSQAITEYNKFK